MAESWDYINFLCKQSGCISVWNDFYYGSPDEKQLNSLRKLNNRSYDKLPNCKLFRRTI